MGDQGEAPCPDAFLDVAAKAADAARPILSSYFRSSLDVISKDDESPVTRADRETEAAIREIIGEAFPEHGILGEEHGAERADAEYVWIIDPLDGTRAFVVGKPVFGTLIALARNGQPILGIIDIPILDERWIGADGRPTTLNGAPASARQCASLSAARINTTSPAMFEGADALSFARVRDAALDCNYGGDCYGYGLVASGHVDLTIETGMQPYDFMALAPVVSGAGGVISDWEGAPLTITSNGSVLAAGDARIHAEALRLIAEETDQQT